MANNQKMTKKQIYSLLVQYWNRPNKPYKDEYDNNTQIDRQRDKYRGNNKLKQW